MKASLDGPRLRVERARAKSDALRSELARVLENRYHLVVSEQDPHTGRYALRVGEIEAHYPLIADRWSLEVSEIVHHLRSALDGLVWQLARLNDASPADILAQRRPQIGFPIYTATKGRNRNWCERQVLDTVKLIRAEHCRKIDSLQPYKRGNLGAKSTLWMLHEVNNADKHRLLQVVMERPAGISFGRVVDDDAPGPSASLVRFNHVPLKPNARVGWAEREAIEDMHIQILPAIGAVAFWDGCPAVRRRFVGTLLGQFTDAVHNIVEGFAPDFE